MIRTQLCHLLGIEHPIVQGGMAWVSTAELVVAVSETGALGVLGCGNAPPAWVQDQIRQVKERTANPFGVNFPVFSPFAEDVVRVCTAEKVPVVFAGAGNPTPFIGSLKRGGALVIPVVSSVALAKRLERAGADALVAEGMESGGHVGDVATFPLVPQIVDAVDIPVIAAGGIADGRGLVAALALGAVGVQMGTRFLCTTECPVHANYQAKIAAAGDRATLTTGHSVGHPVRVIKNPMAREFARLEREGAPVESVMDFGTGKYHLACVDGDMSGGSVMAGQSCGLIHDIVPVRELVGRIVREAEDVIVSLRRYTS